MTICSECNHPILNSEMFIMTDGGSVTHSRCYHIANPPRVRETFSEVLCNGDDQVIVRELLIQLVPPHEQRQIIALFNHNMKERHVRRIAK